jgi:hypothetical protein
VASEEHKAKGTGEGGDGGDGEEEEEEEIVVEKTPRREGGWVTLGSDKEIEESRDVPTRERVSPPCCLLTLDVSVALASSSLLWRPHQLHRQQCEP